MEMVYVFWVIPVHYHEDSHSGNKVSFTPLLLLKIIDSTFVNGYCTFLREPVNNIFFCEIPNGIGPGVPISCIPIL